MAPVTPKHRGKFHRPLPRGIIAWCAHCNWGIPFGSGWQLKDCAGEGSKPVHNPDPGCGPYIEAAKKQAVPSS